MFNYRDLNEKNVIRCVRIGLVYRLYIWKPIVIIDKILNGKHAQLSEVVDVKSDAVQATCKKYKEIVEGVRADYGAWCQRRGLFANRKFDELAPHICHTRSRVEYWTLFCNAFGINTFEKLGVTLLDMRNNYKPQAHNTEEGFVESYNEYMKLYLKDCLTRIGQNDFVINSLCTSECNTIELFGAMYWWFEPDMVRERAIAKLKTEVRNGWYDRDIQDGEYIVNSEI